MVVFNHEQKNVLDQMLLNHPLVKTGKMFGYPAYYVNKKLCICLYEDGVGLKLPESSVQKILAEDSYVTHFHPLGKPKMREWIQINLPSAEAYWSYKNIFEESINYVYSLYSNE